MPPPRLRPFATHGRQGGFALLITVTLVAFLVLVLVALATLTRVETQVAGNSQQLGQARQNALMALNIAIGQLQKYAGPDQRVTTTADLIAISNADNTEDYSHVIDYSATTRTPVSKTSRYWTGVWGNGESDISYTTTPENIAPNSGNNRYRGITPKLLNWLVSGNEFASFELNGTQGGVTSPVIGRFTPDMPVAGLTASTTALESNLRFTSQGESFRGILLVGPNSTSDGTTSGIEASFDADNYVVAPSIPIRVPANTIPGLGDSTEPTTVGHYAYWVGDDGVKARANLQNGYQRTDDDDVGINSFIVAQRSGIEFMTGMSIAPDNPQVDPAYDFNTPGVLNVVTPEQLPLIATSSLKQDQLTKATPSRFHDLTTFSYGVLSDTYAGGLKKDLTADLADDSDDFNYRPSGSDPIFTPTRARNQKNLPTWDHLRNWAHTNPDTDGNIDPESDEAQKAGISPILLFASLGMNYYFDQNDPAFSSDNPTESTAKDGKLTLALYPYIVLFNPYSWPIKARDYDVGLRFDQADPALIVKQSQLDENGNPLPYSPLAYIDLAKLAIYPANEINTLTSTFLRLRLSADAEGGGEAVLLPGERYVFMLTDSAISEYSHSTPPVLHRVKSAEDNFTNYFTITSHTLNDLHNVDGISVDTSNSNNENASPQSLRFMQVSAVLAQYKTGGTNPLSDPSWPPAATDFTKIHHMILSAYPLLIPGNTSQFFNEYPSSQETIYDRIYNHSPKAKAVFRVVMLNQGTFRWSTAYRGGFIHTQPRPRYLANTNVRASFTAGTTLESNKSYSIDIRATARPYGAVFDSGRSTNDPQGNTPLYPGPQLERDDFGFGFQDPGRSIGNRAILFDVLEKPDRLLSLGQFQHVPWARYSFYTSYPFANSYSPLRIERTQLFRPSQIRWPEDLLRNSKATLGQNGKDPIYDLSWLLNRAIWDKYFTSSAPADFTQDDINKNEPLSNSRLTYYTPHGGAPDVDAIRYNSTNKEAYNKAAANLLNAGAFNINSTSEQAWRAVLAGPSGLPADAAYANDDDQVETAIPYPRFSRNLTTVVDTTNSPYYSVPSTMRLSASVTVSNLLQAANRGLYLNNPDIPDNPSPGAVVNELARSIVHEIRQRGPFLSLADFINRPLDSSIAGLKGALAAGIDNMNPAVAQVNPDSQTTGIYATMQTLTSPLVSDYKWDPEAYISRTDTGHNQIISSMSAMSPFQLTQADLLSSLGPTLSARSDTFTIRTYGESINPVTQLLEGRAWCEAVVQRVPDYVGGEAPEIALSDLDVASASKAFGRKFKIVSFRWLNPSDI